MTLRGNLYWFLDWVSGGKVKKACAELKMIDNLDSSSQVIADQQKAAIDRLIIHAAATTQFYSQLDRDKLFLDNYPVVDKQVIRENMDKFLSNKYDKNKLIIMQTSGSTGMPFRCYQDRDKKRRVNAEIIFYSGKAGYKVGKKLVILRAVTDYNLKARLRQWLQNTTVIDVGNLSESSIKQMLLKIARASNNSSMMIAYASTYDALSDYFKREKHVSSFSVSGMISSSEILFDETRMIIEEGFGCRCFSRYSNQENGVIGQDDEINNIFIINEAHYYVEIMKMKQDVTADEGEIGRIVVTDLYNYAMPMIRYDTGDTGAVTFLDRNGVKKKAINCFSGRKIDLVYDSYGNPLSPHKISVTFRGFQEVKQFQFIQLNKNEYLANIITADQNVNTERLRIQLLRLLGDEAIINIKHVDDIPILSSGKRHYIVNKMFDDKV